MIMLLAEQYALHLTLLITAVACFASTAFIKTSDRKILKDLGYD